ncbi:HlyD family efflux transporter periplasmic adaptor subunit, partial [Vibrio harveyi]|uniref:HlyD family efflux transporter periplasmic adaptor subunit n=2 Tax=Vibrionaceae TaxID=641 RepID=UPI000B0E595C
SIKESEKNSLPENLQLKLTTIERQISSINTQLYELNNQYEFIKKAPESGIVTAIQSYVGSNINLKTPLLSIIPKDSPLELEMLLPTRSSGFVQVGDHVNIRFDAFPYQKFGMVKGTIISVDKALLLPSDKALPFAVNEAMYQVRAELDNQTVLAYGKSYPLKVGMIADADIILEKRSLLDWLLEPLYSVKGRF